MLAGALMSTSIRSPTIKSSSNQNSPNNNLSDSNFAASYSPDGCLTPDTEEYMDTMHKKDYYRSLRSPNSPNNQNYNASISSRNPSFSAYNGNNPPNSNYSSVRRKSKSTPSFKPSGKEVPAIVCLLDGTEETFMIDKAIYGQQIFDTVCHHLDLIERDYFGLSFRSKETEWEWIELDVKISKQLPPKSVWYFEFRVKFYPPDPSCLLEDLTRYYLCLQIRQDLITGLLLCSFNSYVILGAYVVQSEIGDFSSENHFGTEYIRDQPFAPTDIQSEEMLRRIAEMHRLHSGQNPEEADRNFLENATRLARYGVDMHKTTDSKGQQREIGIYSGGVLLYQGLIRLRRFSWARIKKISYKGREFYLLIRAIDGDQQATGSGGNNNSSSSGLESLPPSAGCLLVFKCSSPAHAKRLWRACVDHHAFFRLREFSAPKRPTLMPGFGNRTFKVPVLRTQQQIVSEAIERPQPRITRTPTQRKSQYLTPEMLAALDSNQSPDSKDSFSAAHNTGTATNRSADLIDGDVALSTGAAPPASRPSLVHDDLVWSSLDCCAGCQVAEAGLLVTADPSCSDWQNTRANQGVKGAGHFYFEVTALTPLSGADCRPLMVGWASSEAPIQSLSSHSEAWLLAGLGQSPGADLSLITGGTAVAHCRPPAPPEVDDVIGCGVSLQELATHCTAVFRFYLNGALLPLACADISLSLGSALFPVVCLRDGARLQANFGRRPFVFHPKSSEPAGINYVPLSQTGVESTARNAAARHTCRINPYDADPGLETSSDGLTVQTSHQSTGQWQGCRANRGVHSQGRFFFEAEPLEASQCGGGGGGLARVGWATDTAGLELGLDSEGWGYGADSQGFGLQGKQAKKMTGGDIENYGEVFSKDDVIGCFLDLDRLCIQFTRNGVSLGKAFDIPAELVRENAFFPAVALNNNTMRFNFGEKAFKFPPSQDWTAVCSSDAGHTKYSRKQGPQIKLRGFSYISKEDLKKTSEVVDTLDSPISASKTGKTASIRPPGSILKSTAVNGAGLPPISPMEANKLNRTMKVERNEPNEFTEVFIDEAGNKVTRTVKKTVTKTTFTTTSENFVGLREETAVHSGGKGALDDDRRLSEAIMGVTQLASEISVNPENVRLMGLRNNV